MPESDQIIDVPFVYAAEVRWPRKRRFALGAFRGTVPLAVPQCDPKDAPAVAEVRNYGLDAVLESQRHTLPYRLIGGEWYFPVVHPKERRPISPTDLRERIADGVSRIGPQDDRDPFAMAARRAGAPHVAVVSALPIEETDVKEVRRSNAEHVRDAIRRHAAEMVFVDGVLHRRIPEPRIAVDRDGGRIVLDFVPDTFSHDAAALTARDRDWPHLAVFPLDALDDAMAYADMIACGDKVVRPPPLRILRPDLLRDRTPAEIALDMAVGVGLQVRGALAFLSREGLMAFADMREATARLEPEREDGADVASFADAYGRLVAALRAALDGDPPEEAIDPLDEALRDADANLIRLQEFAAGSALRPEDEDAIVSLA